MIGLHAVFVGDPADPEAPLVAECLAGFGYTTHRVPSPTEPLTISKGPHAIVIADQHWLGRRSVPALSRLRRRLPDSSLVLISPSRRFELACAAVRLGAVDYLTRPLSRQAVRAALRRCVARQELSAGRVEAMEALRASLRDAEAALARATLKSELTAGIALDAFLQALTFASPEIYDHAKRVAHISVEVAQVLGMTGSDLDVLETAGLLYGVWKPLSERAAGRSDAPARVPTLEQVCQWTGSIPFLRSAAEVLGACEEQYDGSGRPFGIAGSNIPLGARVIAVAEAAERLWDPLLAPAQHDLVWEAVEAAAGTHFDPQIVGALRMVAALARV